MPIAVIKTGGKQYLVKPGDKVKVEKLTGKEGDAVKLETLLLADEKSAKLELGKPTLSIKTEAKITKQGRDKKIRVVKYKSKTRYRKELGHRQNYSQITIA